MFGLGLPELLIILLLVVVFFGAKKLPEIGSGLGKGINNFRDSMKGEEEGGKTEELPKEGDKPASKEE